MQGFDVVARVVRLALESSGEGVETLERSAAQAASAYGVDVDLVLLPEQVILTDRVSGDVARLATVRATPGIFRLDRVAALKRVLNRMGPSLDAAEACRMLDQIEALPPRWSAWGGRRAWCLRQRGGRHSSRPPRLILVLGASSC